MKKLLSWFSAAFGFAMFIVAIFAIRHELHGHTAGEIFAAAGMVPLERLFLALLFTILCHLILTGYDLLAVSSLPSRPRLRSVMLNSFISHAMSMNIGCSSITGGSIRCHYYLRKGMKTADVVRILTFCAITFWLGFFALGGAILLFTAPPVPSFIPLPFQTLQPIGDVMLLALVAYLCLILFRRSPFRIRSLVIPVIPPHITLAQIIISSSEWLLGAAVLYALFPHHGAQMYFHILSLYFLAQVSGFASQVPSGLGVFESVFLALAPAGVDPSRLLGSLLLYRLIFNFLPLTVAGMLLLIREVKHRHETMNEA